MSWNSRLAWSVCLSLVVVAGAPSVADAQRGDGGQGRGGGRPGGGAGGRGPSPPVVVRPSVVVGGYYRPYYYSPFSWGFYGWGHGYPPFAPYPPYYHAGYPSDSAARIQVTPRNTEVYVDGYFAGVVDDFDGFSQRLRVAPGQHEIGLYLDSYRPVSQSIAFQPGATFRIRHAMEPLAPGEVLAPRPTPPAPPPQPGVPYDALGRAIQISPHAPAGEPATQGSGSVSIRVQPGDSIVLIDGERWDSSGPGTRLDVQVGAGTHRVEIQKGGYETFSAVVTVRPGEVTPINVSLAPRQ